MLKSAFRGRLKIAQRFIAGIGFDTKSVKRTADTEPGAVATGCYQSLGYLVPLTVVSSAWHPVATVPGSVTAVGFHGLGLVVLPSPAMNRWAIFNRPLTADSTTLRFVQNPLALFLSIDHQQL
jgi:hypothetical protein